MKIGDENINRFCRLISEINKLNDDLNTEESNFYDGGYSFEEWNKYSINSLKSHQKELKELIKTISE